MVKEVAEATEVIVVEITVKEVAVEKVMEIVGVEIMVVEVVEVTRQSQEKEISEALRPSPFGVAL
ncbi:hypothetical protein WOLCODRAFT_158339 [Wolfiporia cocos MD-104 SS10]|uniref:Uncharacterized protein n=1 Tax=Wolfiporia cocos (strain MD-104) TaxID=742152 RepID=A0A2H3JQ85_WOLCO|nr:hypothetical protein WOLCODRAFT_158339 [Wolfiporia cocos MD-104 SS10]